jgi:hypothetical protein
MDEIGERAEFTLEPKDRRGIGTKQRLESDTLPARSIERFVDDTHTA